MKVFINIRCVQGMTGILHLQEVIQQAGSFGLSQFQTAHTCAKCIAAEDVLLSIITRQLLMVSIVCFMNVYLWFNLQRTNYFRSFD